MMRTLRKTRSEGVLDTPGPIVPVPKRRLVTTTLPYRPRPRDTVTPGTRESVKRRTDSATASTSTVKHPSGANAGEVLYAEAFPAATKSKSDILYTETGTDAYVKPDAQFAETGTNPCAAIQAALLYAEAITQTATDTELDASGSVSRISSRGSSARSAGPYDVHREFKGPPRTKSRTEATAVRARSTGSVRDSEMRGGSKGSTTDSARREGSKCSTDSATREGSKTSASDRMRTRSNASSADSRMRTKSKVSAPDVGANELRTGSKVSTSESGANDEPGSKISTSESGNERRTKAKVSTLSDCVMESPKDKCARRQPLDSGTNQATVLRERLEVLERTCQSLRVDLEKERQLVTQAEGESQCAREGKRKAEELAQQAMKASKVNVEEVESLRRELARLKKSSREKEDALHAKLRAQQEAHDAELLCIKDISDRHLREAKKQQNDVKRHMSAKEEVTHSKIMELTTELQNTRDKLNMTKQAHLREERTRHKVEQSLEAAKESSMKSVTQAQRVAGELEIVELKLRVSEKMCRKLEESAVSTTKTAPERDEGKDLKQEVAQLRQELAEANERSDEYTIHVAEASDTLQQLLRMLKEVEMQRDQHALDLQTAEETMRMNFLAQRDLQLHLLDSGLLA